MKYISKIVSSIQVQLVVFHLFQKPGISFHHNIIKSDIMIKICTYLVPCEEVLRDDKLRNEGWIPDKESL